MRLQALSIAILIAITAAEYRHDANTGHFSSNHGRSNGLGHGYAHGHGHHIDYHAPPHYEFEYSVHDPHTGDFKSQRETRKGDVVKGFYTLKEADGTTREVHYTADKHHGFNAIVKRIGHAIHPHHTSHYSELSYH